MRCRPARSRAGFNPSSRFASLQPLLVGVTMLRTGMDAPPILIRSRNVAELAVVMAQSADDDGRAVRHRDKRRKRRGRPARAEVPDDTPRSPSATGGA